MQIQQRMHLHRRLVLTKLGPRKEREAKIDGGGVQSIQTLVQIDIDRIARIERARDSNQDLRKVGIDSPVAGFVCVSQSGSCHLAYLLVTLPQEYIGGRPTCLGQSPFLFPSPCDSNKPIGSVKKAWRTTLKRAGVSYFPIYNLRQHVFCTRLSWVAPGAVVQRAMRHSSPETKRVYQLGLVHQVREHMQRANDKADQGREALHCVTVPRGKIHGENRSL